MKALGESGREIKTGDALRVFHFVSIREKKHYMRKTAGDYVKRGAWTYLVVHHTPPSDGSFLQLANGKPIDGWKVKIQ